MKAVRFVEGVRDKLVPIDTVKQHPDNPNNGDIENLIESIQVNDFYSTVTVDRATGYILAGNHRYQALLALGAKEIPVVYVDKDRHGTLRVLVGDNKSGRLARPDLAQEIEVLKELATSDLGFAGSGYTQDTFLALLQEVAGINPIPTADGFGHGVAPSGIFQVVLDFKDEDARDECFATLSDEFGDDAVVRTTNL